MSFQKLPFIQLIWFFLLIGIINLCPGRSKAQNVTSIQWDKTIGGTLNDILTCMKPTADGGYILGGYSWSGVGGDKSQPFYNSSFYPHDYWVVKVDAFGNKIWDKTLGGTHNDVAYSILQTTDGGYLVAGSSSSGVGFDKTQPSRGGSDYWIVKLDANGNKLWDRTFGGFGHEELVSVKLTPDGGFMLAGTSTSGISGDKTQGNTGTAGVDFNYWMVRTDANGNKLWDKTFGPSGSSLLYSMDQTSDGGFILGGHSYAGIGGDKTEPSRGNSDFWVLKTDNAGNKQWDKTLGGNLNDHLKVIKQTADGGYILGGNSASNVGGDKTQASRGGVDSWLVKIGPTGNKIWDKTFGGTEYEEIMGIVQTPDGGYLVGGHSSSGVNSDKSEPNRGVWPAGDYWVIKVTDAGIKEWDKTIGGIGQELLSAIEPTADGGYMLAGNSESCISGEKGQSSKGSLDYWLVKLKGPCSGLSASLSVTCNGTSTAVVANILGWQPAIPAWQLIYTVNGVAQIQTGTSPAFTIHPNSIPGTVYTLVSITSGNCSFNLNQTLTVQPGSPPPAPVTGGATRCGSGPVTLSATGAATGAIYNWYDAPVGGKLISAATSGIFVTPVISATTTYYVAVMNPGGCEGQRIPVAATVTFPACITTAGFQTICQTAGPVQLTGFFPAGGTWSGPGVTPNGVFTPNNNLLGYNNLTYTSTINNCTATGVQVIEVVPPPVVNAGPDRTICSTSGPIQLSGATPAGGLWSGPGVSGPGVFTPGPGLVGSQTLTYTVTRNGCSVSDTRIIEVTDPPVLTVGGNDTICVSAPPYQLTGFSPAGGVWSGPGVSASGIFSPAVAFTGSKTLTYTVSQDSCIITATKRILVTPLPNVGPGPIETFCENSAPKQLTGFYPPGGTWSGSGVSEQGHFTPSASLIGTQVLTYTVKAYGCTIAVNKRVIVNPALKVSLGPDLEICEGTEMTLQPDIIAGTFLWNDGSKAGSLKIKGSGTYWVQVALNGCIATDTLKVSMKGCQVLIPNIVTPNADNLNDVFSPQFPYKGKWKLWIYNRLGSLVYEADDYQNTWPENKVGDGVYFYLLINPVTKQQFKGWVEVLN